MSSERPRDASLRQSRLEARVRMAEKYLGHYFDDTRSRELWQDALSRAQYYLGHPEIDGGRLPHTEPWAVLGWKGVEEDLATELQASWEVNGNNRSIILPNGRTVWVKFSRPHTNSYSRPGRFYFQIPEVQLYDGWGFALICGAHDQTFFIPRAVVDRVRGSQLPSGNHYHVDIYADDRDLLGGSPSFSLSFGAQAKEDIGEFWLRYDLLGVSPFHIEPWPYLAQEEPGSGPDACAICGRPLTRSPEHLPWAYAVYAGTQNLRNLICTDCRRSYAWLRLS